VKIGVGENVGFAVGVCVGVGVGFSRILSRPVSCAETGAPKLKPKHTIIKVKKPAILTLFNFLFIKLILREIWLFQK
jgi:hypothetical protein